MGALGTLLEQKARSLKRMGVGNLFARPGLSRRFFEDAVSDLNGGMGWCI